MSLALPIRNVAARYVTRRVVLSLDQSIVSRTLPIANNISHRLNTPRIPVACRNFTTSSPLQKKKSKADREAQAEVATTEFEDPEDFSILDTSISKALDRLKDDLSKLRTGGRFNPETLENLRVRLDKDSKKTERLGDLAQVLPKTGRSLMILVGEKEHVHSIISAIQGSPELNLQPQPDQANPSQLNVPIPPPTKESRDAAMKKAGDMGETARTSVQSARAVCQKRLRGMEVKKSVRPDDLKKAAKKMEGVVEKGVADVKKMVEVAKKGMEQA